MEPTPAREDVPVERQLGLAMAVSAPLATSTTIVMWLVALFIVETVQNLPFAAPSLVSLVIGLVIAPLAILWIAGMAFVFGMLVGWPITLLLWMPLYLLLRRLGLNGRNIMLIGGLATGLLAMAIIQAMGWPLPLISSLSPPAALLWYGATGMLAAYIFWLIRRPDRDNALTPAPSPPT